MTRKKKKTTELYCIHNNTVWWKMGYLPTSGFSTQKSGEDSKYTRSERVGFLWLLLATVRLMPFCFIMTWVAPLYRVLRCEPTSRNSCIANQHVRMVQEPLTPWHLHSSFLNFLTAYITLERKKYRDSELSDIIKIKIIRCVKIFSNIRSKKFCVVF